MNKMTCEHCQQQLFDLMSGDLADSVRADVDAHLETCEDCQNALTGIWEMEAASTRWENQRVPHWNRRETFFEPRQWLPVTQFAGAAASVLLLVIVVTQLNVDTADGIRITFGPDYVTESEVSNRLARIENSLADELAQLRQQQAAGDRLVLTSLLETSRRERQDDLADLVYVLNDVDERRDMRTREALQYLISTQQEDRKDIQQLNEAIQLVGNSGGRL